MYFHKEVFFYLQKKLGMNNDFEIGCTNVSVNSEKFVVKLIGGKDIGVKYYGFIPIKMSVDSEKYVVIKNTLGEGEIYFQSIKNVESMRYMKLKKMLETGSGKLKDYSLMMIENKYSAIKSLSQKESGIEIYEIPSLNLSIGLKDIFYDKELFRIESFSNCK